MKRLSTLPSLMLLAAFAACDDGAAPPVDSGSDLQQTDQRVGDGPVVDAPPTKARDYVLNGMVVPSTQADVEKYARDVDGDQKPDNALGGILATLAAAVQGMDLQGEMTQNIWNGRVVLLFRLTASSFTTAAAASLQAWTGEEATCCAAKPCSEADAKQSCFSGSHSFTIDSTSPQNAVLDGSIAGGQLQAGPAEVEVLLPIGKFPARVTLREAVVEARVGAEGLADGKISGVVSKADLDSKVVPSVAQVLDGELNDPSTKTSVKEMITQLFDANQDGTIDVGEVAQNGLIQTMLAGDVDVDKDGQKELSAGVGFSAVPCTIAP